MINRRLILSPFLICIAGSAAASERHYSIADFDHVRLVGASRVIIDTGRATTVRANGPQSAIEALSIEVQDRILTIQPLAGTVATPQNNDSGPVTVFITMPRLTGAKLNGAGAIKIADLRGAQTDVSITGSGQISIAQVNTDRLSARLSGSGTLTMAGKALILDANVKGSGSVAASNLAVTDLKLSAASSGLVSLSAQRTAAITSTGSGTVAITGAPSCTVQNIGVGTVACGKAR
jgi:Putative auto-transporter adhesin, head GIN domain